ncbi:hypothetical protein B0H14DRAFT_2605459 [Mycena olivaceomarginata]|nr:hypothetical protein B0H14DRAFT_2605459 [Mycena olivaceomarginata]
MIVSSGKAASSSTAPAPAAHREIVGGWDRCDDTEGGRNGGIILIFRDAGVRGDIPDFIEVVEMGGKRMWYAVMGGSMLDKSFKGYVAVAPPAAKSEWPVLKVIIAPTTDNVWDDSCEIFGEGLCKVKLDRLIIGDRVVPSFQIVGISEDGIEVIGERSASDASILDVGQPLVNRDHGQHARGLETTAHQNPRGVIFHGMSAVKKYSAIRTS